MEELVILNEKFRKIDDNYFSSYGVFADSGGKRYSDNYLEWTANPAQVFKELIARGIYFKTILDIGCASGEVVRDFRKLGLEAYGIENNIEILKMSVVPDFCFKGDLLNLTNIKDKSVNVIYCNALMYLLPTEVSTVLKEFNRIANKAVYLNCPFLDNSSDLANDPYRVFMANKSWWEKQFKDANFFKVSDNIYINEDISLLGASSMRF